MRSKSAQFGLGNKAQTANGSCGPMAAQRGFATPKSARIGVCVFRACKPFEDRKQALTNVPSAALLRLHRQQQQGQGQGQYGR